MIIKSYGLYLATFRLCRHPLLSALPSPPLQPAPVTLAKVPFLQVTAFRGSNCSQEFPPPTQSQASLPTPGRACAGWGVQSQHKARTLHPQVRHKTHLLKVVGTEQAGKAAGRSARLPSVLPAPAAAASAGDPERGPGQPWLSFSLRVSVGPGVRERRGNLLTSL